MTDKLHEAGVIVAHLSRALLDGTRDLRTVPDLVKKIITDKMWGERLDPSSGRKLGPFGSFRKLVETPASQGGLGSTVSQILGLCEGDKEARSLVAMQIETEQPTGGDRRSSTFKHDNIRAESEWGTSESYALRRLRRDRPDLHERVLLSKGDPGRLSAHAAMVQAGFQQPQVTLNPTSPKAVARVLRKRMSPEALEELVKLLKEDA